MPIPATLTSYLPVLLVSVTHNAAPDDSSFVTLPEGQVDYLSHDWKEEDVWRSWRSMTRQKNAIANGMRLENASWRTWWKQRNKLKTISPETLNWLKDSDVTWLYGPLHIGHDWTDYSTKKIPKLAAIHRKTSTDHLPGPYKTNKHLKGLPSPPAPLPKKPILKRRSISQLLSLPASPFFNHLESDEESEERDDGSSTSTLTRPPLMHTKSDTHISLRGRPFRKNSPPRIIAEDGTAPPVAQLAPGSEASGSTGSDQDLSGSSSIGVDGSHGPGGKKKHISFNTFVEQCIAIEKPKTKRTNTGPTREGRVFDAYDDGYDSELGYEGEYEEPVSYYGPGSDSDDDDDDVLEMRTASSRSRSSSSSRSSPFATTFGVDTTAARPRPPMVRRASTDREHVTIAPIPPTLLKSTGVGNELGTVLEGRMPESPNEVDLVWVPPASYSQPGTPNLGSNEDVYHHRESYFSVGTSSPYPRSPLARSPVPGSSPRIPSVGMPAEHSIGGSSLQRSNSGTFYGAQSMVDSPMQIDDIAHPPVGDAYDYFGGPDLGEDFSQTHLSRRRSRTDVRDDDGDVIMRVADGSASSVTMGRSNSGGWHATSSNAGGSNMPVVVVNEASGAVEERQERSRESSPARPAVAFRLPEQEASPPTAHGSLPSTPAVPVPRVNSAHSQLVSSSISSTHSIPSSAPGSAPCDPALLSADGAPSRGRTPHSPSVSGSTTTGSSSYSHSTDSRSASSSRGRSSTRTSSFSDHERSGSRSRSRGTSSPMGSISPTGSAIGIGSAYAGTRCRDRGVVVEQRSSRRRGGEEERGRERTGRRLGDSLSPPNAVGSPSRGSDSGDGAYQPYSPVLSDIPEKSMRIPSPPSSVSGSSTETASVSTVGPSQAQQEAREALARPSRSADPAAKLPTVAVAIPSPIPEEEEEERRSRQPTPANSPVAAFRMQVPPAQKAEPVPSPVFASHEPPSSSTATSPSTGKSPETSPSPPSPSEESPKSPDSSNALRHPTRAQRVSFDGMQEQAGTLVNRAAEIVQSARGFLGSIWN
ncbi:protein phosphatase regulator REG1 [Trametes versicolor FP-101664 SS1]|uniref:protein phosphatase regulator REG1 n=1 Tax=Trametes versicolor (strain FP-101664) TaxID=717944 RepID=UPI00046226B5|nr:protein phosphatase regulator REG1 [Trametes versicolor FP-101664 SS1]EIW58597.1 hypothetical protein TRAVEDRAFT_64943 [Trametes versicolor FP-101664 SS1]